MKVVFVLLLGIGLSQGAPPIQPKAAPPVVTDAQLDRWLKLWQKRLSLGDWQISAELVRSWELKPDTLGNLRWNSASKMATIRVMSPQDYDLRPSEIPTDIEYTIVHELIHLQLALIPKAAGAKEVEERVVNRLGEALFALEKGPHYRPRAAVTHITTKDKSSEASRSAR